jgi:hypothetical protein
MPRVTTLSSLTTLTLFVPTVSGTISVSPWILNTPQDYITALGVTYTNSSSNGLITTIGVDANNGLSFYSNSTPRIETRHTSNGNLYWAKGFQANTHSYPNHISVERYETSGQDIPSSLQKIYAGISHATTTSALRWSATLLSFEQNGTLNFQRQLYHSANDMFISAISSDTTGVSMISVSGHVVKLNTSGTQIFAKKYTAPSGHSSTYGRAITSYNGKIWFTSDSSLSGTFYSQVFSVTSAGAISWRSQVGLTGGAGGSNLLVSETICVDTSENVYLGGRNTLVTGFRNGHIIKLSNTGTLEWAKSFANVHFYNCSYSKMDDAVYFSGRDYNDNTILYITKISPNGTIQFSKSFKFFETALGSGGSGTSVVSDRYGYYYTGQWKTLGKFHANGSGSVANSSINKYYADDNRTVSNAYSNITRTTSTATIPDVTITYTTTLITPTTVYTNSTITLI